jgi:hypothetical protein
LLGLNATAQDGIRVRDHRGQGLGGIVVRDHRTPKGDTSSTRPPFAIDPHVPPLVVNTPPSTLLEDTPIYRAQIKIRTADRDDAGQDDGVKIRLNDGNETWLDSGADDFERGQTRTYDLLQFNASGSGTLTKLRDIQMLEISKTGSDGWCVSDVELIINGRPIYKINYPQGKWLDNSGGARLSTTIDGATMRGSAEWRGYTPPAPSPVLARAELESRVEAIIGHFAHGRGVGLGQVFGGRAVEVTRAGDNMIHVDLDMEAYVDYAPDPELDVDFDIEFQSSNNQIQVTVKNVKADLHSTLATVLLKVNSIFGGTSKDQLVSYINRQLRRQLEGAMFAIPTGNLNLSVSVTPAGDVILLPR